MLYLSLIFSGVLLLGSIWAALRAVDPFRATLKLIGAVLLISLTTAALYPAVMLQSCLTIGLWVFAAGRPRRVMVMTSVAAFVLAYVVVGVEVFAEQREYARMRSEWAYESMEPRLPRLAPPSKSGDPKLLDRIEVTLDNYADGAAHALEVLHDRPSVLLIDSPHFGESLWYPRWRKWLNRGHRNPAPLQPPVTDAGMGRGRVPDEASLARLHEDCIREFAAPFWFGFVKDRQHVAGFQPHGFDRLPAPFDEWGISRLELVGLLLHENPVVYESAKLPRMDELRGAPTRAPDAFESRALAALREGADLHVGDGAEGLRFLGAVRSTKQCLECHGGDRGALLGAFSYRLRPAK